MAAAVSRNGYRRPRDEAEKVQRRLARYSEAIALVDAVEARPEVVEVVGLLRQGLNGCQIAERLGLSKSATFQRLKDPTDEKNKARKARHHGTCLDCSGPTFNAGSPNTPERCFTCRKAYEHEVSVAWLVAEVHHWVELYGQPPSAFEWHPANMRWKNRAYVEGRATGRFSDATVALAEQRYRESGPWPSPTSAQQTFGSWSAMIEAAGFEPLPVGKKRSVREAVAA
jgi:hypothetical protein